MAKEGGKLLIKYRDPVAASFSSKDIVMNVQTGTLFYKRNRKLYALRGTPDNFDLVVFPGQSTNQQILFNDGSQEDGSPIMEGTDQFRFKIASATCGCANYFHIGAETLTHFSGSVRIGEHLPGTCNLLDGEVNPSLLVHGNMEVSASAGGIGNISASGNIEASIDLYGTNAYIHDSLIHRGNTDTKLTFGTDTINLYSDGSNIATVSSDKFTINGSNDLYIPGTDSSPASGTSVLVINNADGRVYKTGSYGGETFKQTGQRSGDSEITGSLTLTSHLTASANISASGHLFLSASLSNNNLQTLMYDTSSGQVFFTGSYGGDGTGGGTDIQALDEGNSLTAAATSFNFVGNAVTASASSNAVTVTINAVTKSLWYDGQPHYISSSDNVFIDKKLGIGTQWYGQTVGSSSPTHEIHLTASGDEISVGYTGVKGHTWSTGTTLGGSNLFSINDIGDSGAGQSLGNRVIAIYGTGSGLPGNYSLRAPEAISIAAALKSGGQSPNPTFIGATDTTIPAVMIDPVGISSSLAKFHINTMGVDDGELYNGLCVGPYYDPSVFTNQKTGSGLFLHIGAKDGYTVKDGNSPRITAKTEAGNAWYTTRALVICGEVDRSVGYTSSSFTGYSSGMEFVTKDVSKKAYSASLYSDGIHGAPHSQSMDEVYGSGSQFIIGGRTIPRVSFSNTNYLYTFLNDTMPLLAMEATGKIGIGNFKYGGINTPLANLHIAARSGSDADILLQTRYATSPTTIPSLKLEMGGHSNGSRLYNPTKYGGEFYVRNEYTSGNFYDFQKISSTVIESRGIEEGLSEHHYPFNIKGAAKNNFKANNIQFVVGGDNSPYNNSITSSLANSGSLSETILSNNNGRAAITIEGISDFRRMGEVGIGLENPSSSLHVTRSVQADNFRTTNPLDILITGTNPSIQTIYGSNQLIGSNTQFTSDFKAGDAIKVKGRSIIVSTHREYALSSSLTSASSTVGNSNTFIYSPQTFLEDDMILISSESCGTLFPLIDQTGTFHQMTAIDNGGVSGHVVDLEIEFTPAYTGTTTSSAYLVHRVNPHHYQIATVDSIHSDTSMSISQNWEGITWSGSTGYKEDILFQVKTADYNPVFTVNAHGDITASGTASFGYLDINVGNSAVQTFKDDGVRVGDSSIDGDLTVTGTLTAQEFHTEFVSSSIIFTSGSTQFGNSSDDTHTFSGSIHVKDEGHITASGNISASGTGSFEHIQLPGGGTIQFDDTVGSNDQWIIGNDNNITVDGDAKVKLIANDTIEVGIATNDIKLTIDTSEGHITASGNISSSGKLYGGLSNTNNANLVFYNPTGGELTYAASSSFLAGLISSSAQIATDISGAIDAATGSLLSSYTFLSSSAQIADDISGSWQSQDFANLSAAGISGSFLLNTTDTLTGDLFVTNNITASGDISSSGNIDGSTAEIHTSLNVGTTLEVGGLSTLQETITTNIFVDGHITASGNISASGKLFAETPSVSVVPTNSERPVVYNPTTGEFSHHTSLSNFFFHNSIAKYAFKFIDPSSGTNAAATNASDTLYLNGGSNITVTGDGSNGIEIAYTGGTGTMSSFTLEGDTGTDQTIANGNTLSIFGGTGITTATSATDDLTVTLDLSELTDMTQAMVSSDEFIVLDNSADRRKAASGIGLSIFNNNIDGTFLSVDASNNLDFTPGGTNNGVITSNGTSGATVESKLTFNTDLRVEDGDVVAFYSSDKRLKDNITPITNPISKIMKINGYTFDWNKKQDTYNGHDVGVIAQEVEKVLPEVVETRENGYKAVKYDKMVPLLIEAIKDQQKQINELKKLIK